MKNKINEGLKIGAKEKKAIAEQSNNFNIGIEYEFHIEGLSINSHPSIDDFVRGDDGVDSIEEISISDYYGSYSAYHESVEQAYVKPGELPFGEFSCVIDSLVDDYNTGFKLVVYGDDDHDLELKFENESNADEKESIADLDDYITSQNIVELEFISDFFKELSNFKELLKDEDQGDLFPKEKEQEISQSFMDELYERTNFEDFQSFEDSMNNDFIFGNGSEFAKFINDLIVFVNDFMSPFNDGDTIDDSDLVSFLKDFVSKHKLSLEDYELNSNEILKELLFNSNNSLHYFMVVGGDYVELYDELDSIPSSSMTSDESGGGQVEIITDKLSLDEGIDHLKSTLELIRSNDSFITNDDSGLHISISSNVFNESNFNMLKFVVLHKFDYISDNFFDERNVHVANIADKLKNVVIRDVVKFNLVEILQESNNFEEFMSELEDDIIESIGTEKFLSISFKDFHYSNGRIELRYFGGEDYENKFNEILNLLLRSLYILSISFTDAFDKEYMKSLYRLIDDDAKDYYGMSLGELRKMIKNSQKIINKFPDMEDALQHYSKKFSDTNGLRKLLGELYF